MPQVSKKPVNEKILKRIFEIFINSIMKLKGQKETAGFFITLLTSTEQIMIAKRFSIGVLLARGYDYDSIKDILKVSQGTISSVKDDLSEPEEGYQKVISRILREEKIKKIFAKIDGLLDVVPPKGGDWSAWQKRKWEKKMKRQEPF